ncbi:hypothetical protein VTN77DRAFT_7938 [Rasamsonia byssochlamydoides]|uniref:uncharacterized protein n=1 Tax=Rasamsonia byssochlamydoides TaxID=89139 RepID=UPI00374202A8
MERLLDLRLVSGLGASVAQEGFRLWNLYFSEYISAHWGQPSSMSDEPWSRRDSIRNRSVATQGPQADASPVEGPPIGGRG